MLYSRYAEPLAGIRVLQFSVLSELSSNKKQGYRSPERLSIFSEGLGSQLPLFSLEGGGNHEGYRPGA